MCSILGATIFDETSVEIWNRAKDRGRDYSGMSQYGNSWIANHRATPTNEIDKAIRNQPFGKGFKVVHNGTIANDMELGNEANSIDSEILTQILNTETLIDFYHSLSVIKGSFAIAVLKENGDIYLACNYKPIFYFEKDGNFYFSSLKRHLPSEKVRRVKPYSVLSLRTGESYEFEREQPDRALIVCSGGLDSTSLIGYARQKHSEIKLLHFDYGCRATSREIEAIQNIAKRENIEYQILPIDYSLMRGNSPLFKDEKIDNGKDGVEYASEWVYARNLILLSYAVGYAEANKYGYIYLGNNLEESGAYPDNEEQFVIDFNDCLWGAVNNGYKVEILNPLGGLMKKEIVEFGTKYNSPIDLSWSCYNNEEFHCGECAPCYMRKKAFERAGIQDPTKYNEK